METTEVLIFTNFIVQWRWGVQYATSKEIKNTIVNQTIGFASGDYANCGFVLLLKNRRQKSRVLNKRTLIVWKNILTGKWPVVPLSKLAPISWSARRPLNLKLEL